MKKSVIGLASCLCICLLLTGCGEKEISAAKIVRDDARVGGTLSFVYDSADKTVYVGGDGEVVQYFSGDESNGIDEGNRVGLKVIAPNENIDINEATLQMNGNTYAAGEFLESVDGQKQRYFNIYPLVGEKQREVKFSVKWSDGVKEQEYKLVVLSGTKFMEKE